MGNRVLSHTVAMTNGRAIWARVRAYEGKRRVTVNGALMWYERVMRAWAGVVVVGLSHLGSVSGGSANFRCNGSAIVECETRDSAPNRTDRTHPLCSRSPHVVFSFPSSSLTSRIPILVFVQLFSPSTLPDRSQTNPIYDKANVPSFHSATTTILSLQNIAHITTLDQLNIVFKFDGSVLVVLYVSGIGAPQFHFLFIKVLTLLNTLLVRARYDSRHRYSATS